MAPTEHELQKVGSWQEAEALGRWLAGEPYEELDYDPSDNTPYCHVCDALGHSGGEFGELCLSIQPAGYFDPSHPRELEDGWW